MSNFYLSRILGKQMLANKCTEQKEFKRFEGKVIDIFKNWVFLIILMQFRNKFAEYFILKKYIAEGERRVTTYKKHK